MFCKIKSLLNIKVKTYCDLCKTDTNHKTEEHICYQCYEVGKHTTTDHINCRLCLEDHNTKDHICNKCNQLGHRSIDHKCTKCDEPHETKYHPCDVCSRYGCNKNEHDECILCDTTAKFKYTHHTKDHMSHHVYYDGLSLEDIKTKYKRCQTCNLIVVIKNDKCVLCNSTVSKYIKCNNPKCNYIMDNYLYIHCPFCCDIMTCQGCYAIINSSQEASHYRCISYC